MRWWVMAAALLAAIVAFSAPRDVGAAQGAGESELHGRSAGAPAPGLFTITSVR